MLQTYSQLLSSLLALTIIPTLVLSHPVIDSVDPVQLSNISTTNNASEVGLDPQPHHYFQCTSSPTWITPRINPQDCSAALSALRNENVILGQGFYEFYSIPFGHPQYHLPQIPTPVTYTRGTCTIGIAMIIELDPRLLPGLAPAQRAWRASDVSKWGDIFLGALEVYERCIRRNNNGGWISKGRYHGGIATAVYATGSNVWEILKPPNNNLNTNAISNETAAVPVAVE